MQKFADQILRFRWLTILLVATITIFLGYYVSLLSINADIIDSLPDDDPNALMMKKVAEKYGGNNMGIIILETDDVFRTEVLGRILTITDTLSSIYGISSVTSLTNIINISGDEFGMTVGPLVDEYMLPESKEELDQLREKVMAKEMYRGSIVSEDGTATLIVFTLFDDADVRDVAQTVIRKTDAMNIPETVYYIGSPMLVNYISDLMRTDLIRLLPIAILLISLILLLSFRSFKGVVLPIITAVIAIVWVLGIMALTGYQMSMISNNMPIILLAVGSAYTIHVLNRINQVMEKDYKLAIRRALAYVLVPVFLAAITTMIGFISFVFGAYLQMIIEFGLFTALGTFFACILSLFFVPALLAAFTSSKRDEFLLEKKLRTSLLSERFLRPLKNLLFKHPKYILTSWTLLILISIVGTFFIERSVDIQDYFKKNNPTRKAEQLMVEKFGGTKPVFVTFKGDMLNPDVLKTMLETGEYMEQSPDIVNTQSVADLVAEMNSVMGGERTIPDEREKIEQLWFFLYGNETVNRFVSEDMDEGVLISRFVSGDNNAKVEFAAYMESFIREHSKSECQIEITGMPFIDITMDRSLVNSQIGSLAIAVLFVVIIVGLILRSFLNGLYATLPILAAILILFGVMGFAGISLNMATVLVASVALGIGIDYSIHVITHFNHTFRRTGNVHKAIEETILISGKAIIINVTSVSAGFLVLLFSEMVPLQYFGLLIALSMLGSSQGAITLLPVILILVNRKKNNTFAG